MSATTSEDVDRLTKLVLHNPLTLNLLAAAGNEEAGLGGDAGAASGGGAAAEISHYRIGLPPAASTGAGSAAAVETAERLLHLLVLLKYSLVPKKVGFKEQVLLF